MALGRDVESSLPNPSETTPLIPNLLSNIADPTTSTSSRKGKGASRQIDFAASTGHATPTLEGQEVVNNTNDATGDSKHPVRTWCISLYSADFVALNLENSGSVARDHLASERTFLAYVRTSLAVASSGVALIQLFTVASHRPDAPNTLALQPSVTAPYIRPLGGVAILLGIVVLVIGASRYFIVQSALTKGKFPAARLAMGFIAVSLTALVTVIFAILLAGKLNHEGPGTNPFP